MKIVINTKHGGFSISKKAAEFMAERGCPVAGAELKEYSNNKNFYGYGFTEKYDGYARNDALLVQAVETLGDTANGYCASLKVVEIPDDVEWIINEYDGAEWISEAHRTWD